MMLDDDGELERLLGPLRDGPIALNGKSEADALRARVVPILREQVRELPAFRRRSAVRRRAVVIAGTLSMAAAALFALRIALPSDGDTGPGILIEPIADAEVTWTDAEGRSHPLSSASRIDDVSEVQSTKGRARLYTQSGAHVELAPRTRIALAGKGQTAAGLRLLSGSVECQVPPLGDNRHFSVATADARVVVHGTRFRVQVSGDEVPRTCVEVSEGLVSVERDGHEVKLGPGERSGCDETIVDATDDAEELGRATPAPRRKKARPAARMREPVEAPLGTLDEENRLLGAALGAERANSKARAHALFERLLERYPNSPLAPEARAGAARTQ